LTGVTERRASRVAVVSVLLAISPVVVAAAGAVGRRWLPVGDNAYFAIRARDVFTVDPPLLGTWTSASRELPVDVNNPGPLLFDLLALPTTLVPGGVGVAVAAAVVNVLAIVGIAWVARRLAGPLGVGVAMAGVAGLCWAMGSELLFQPWQPHSLLLPFLLFLFVAWSIGDGDAALLPLAALVASLLVQTHLTYAVMVPALALAALIGLALVLRAERRRARTAGAHSRRRLGGTAVLTAAVLAVSWARPVIEQVTVDGGNLLRLARHGGAHPLAIGYGPATRLLAGTLAVPPWTSFRRLAIESDPSSVVAVVSLAALAAVGVVVAWRAGRRGDRTVVVGIVMAAVVVISGWVTLGRMPPVGAFIRFGVAPHHVIWLWPVTTFVACVLAVALVRWLRHREVAPLVLVAGCTLVVAAGAVGNLPVRDRGATQPAWAVPVARSLDRQLGEVDHPAPVLVRGPGGYLYHLTSVMAGLQRRGVPFVVDDPVLERQLGSGRRFTGDNAGAMLVVATGDEAELAPPGGRLVALHLGLRPDEREERAALARRIVDHADQQGAVALTGAGRRAVRTGYMEPSGIGRADTAIDLSALFAPDQVAEMATFWLDHAVLDPVWEARLRRYVSLDERWQERTVGVSLAPLP
jgi:hypothetical protein